MKYAVFPKVSPSIIDGFNEAADRLKKAQPSAKVAGQRLAEALEGARVYRQQNSDGTDEGSQGTPPGYNGVEQHPRRD
jgi:hypothetical protein